MTDVTMMIRRMEIVFARCKTLPLNRETKKKKSSQRLLFVASPPRFESRIIEFPRLNGCKSQRQKKGGRERGKGENNKTRRAEARRDVIAMRRRPRRKFAALPSCYSAIIRALPFPAINLRALHCPPPS